MLRPLIILSLFSLVSCSNARLNKSSFFVGASHDQSIAGWFKDSDKETNKPLVADTVENFDAGNAAAAAGNAAMDAGNAASMHIMHHMP